MSSQQNQHLRFPLQFLAHQQLRKLGDDIIRDFWQLLQPSVATFLGNTDLSATLSSVFIRFHNLSLTPTIPHLHPRLSLLKFFLVVARYLFKGRANSLGETNSIVAIKISQPSINNQLLSCTPLSHDTTTSQQHVGLAVWGVTSDFLSLQCERRQSCNLPSLFPPVSSFGLLISSLIQISRI